MSSQHTQPRGKIYFPPCRNKFCEEWVTKIATSLKTEIDPVTKHNINGPYISHFKRLFEECSFTVLHYCPHLWKRISTTEKDLRNQENKLILVRFEEDRLFEGEDNDSLEKLFTDFDSAQVISDDAEVLQSFKQELLSCLTTVTSPAQKDFALPISSASTEFTHPKGDEMVEDSSDDDKDEKDIHFEKYPECISNVNHLFVSHKFAHFDGHKEISFDQTDIKSLKKTMRLINELEDKFTEEKVTSTLKYILHWLIPEFYTAKDVVKLASFSMCKHPHIHERALDFLELLLWEKVDSVRDLSTMINMEQIFTEALHKLNLDYEASDDKGYLVLLQRVAHLYLILIGSVIIQSHETPDISSRCSSYLNTRCESPFDSSKLTQAMNFDLEKQLDAKLCLGIINSVTVGAKKCKQVIKYAEQSLSDDISEDMLGKLIKKNNITVQLVVVLQLLRKVFLLDTDALSRLEMYMKGPKEKFPFVFMILHSLSTFLLYKTQKITHQDISMFCQNCIAVIRQAIPNTPVKQVDNFLQRLLFSSNHSIRQHMIKLFSNTERYGLMFAFLQNEMEERLSPLLTNFKLLPGPNNENYGWRKASGQFSHEAVWIFSYFMTEKDHKMNQTKFVENENMPYTEMKRLACLQHKNIITMFAYHQECIPQFYIIENCEQKLQEHLKNKWNNDNCYTPSQLLKFLIDAASGLKHCHNKDYVHCNLTAESLIVVNDSLVKLTGFGLCKKIEASSEKAMEINSKDIPLRWSAPESILEGEYSKASDIWMFGHLLFEIMTHGLLPYSYMELNDDELIELMKTKQLKLTIEQTVEKIAILHLLSNCVTYEQESRIYIANVQRTLKDILIRVEQAPARKIAFPKIDNMEKKSSTNFNKGIPQKFHKRTGMKRNQPLFVKVNISESVDKIREGEDFIFREKVYHKLSTSMESFFSSSDLDNILPQRREIVQYASEMKHIECKIPNENCFSLLDVAYKKMVNNVNEVIFCLHKVAVILTRLSKHSYVIGDLCARHVFVELGDNPKVHIISLAYLRTINCQEELSQSEDLIPESVKKRASPEVIKSGHFSAASDVFCFGNFMWESLAAFSDRNESSLGFNRKIFKRITVDKLYDAILSDQWEAEHLKPKCCPDSLYELIKTCVSVRENDRPTINHVAVKLLEYCPPIVEDVHNTSDSHLLGENYTEGFDLTRLSLCEINPSIIADSDDTSCSTKLSIANLSDCSCSDDS